MGRPKTVALLREEAIGHGTKALKKLASYATKDDGGDPRMAAVIERACEALLDRIGLVPAKPMEVAAEPEKPKASRDMTNEELEHSAAEGHA